MESNNSEKESYHFQVNLGGMLDILSNHLYKSPDVFLRELLQNGVDAITLRQKKQPGWNSGRITISLEPGRRLEIRDNGAGLTEDEIHRFLAVIGQSSKTELLHGQMPEDYIGRFGIGLLSCFMVSDSIVVHTQPLDGGQAHVWTGMPDGTYTLEPLYRTLYYAQCRTGELDAAPHSGHGKMDGSSSAAGGLEHAGNDGVLTAGTTVILTAKPDMGQYFQPKKVIELVQYYGLALPVPVYLSGNSQPLNCIPSDFAGASRGQLLSFGEWVFDEEFLEAIPIQTPHLSGVAYVLPYRTDVTVKTGHRIYLKQMLLTESGATLLPAWAFFLRCFLNTKNLRPTASREDFYEDEELVRAKGEFEEAVRAHLEEMAREEEHLLQQIVRTHEQAIKAMAVWDDGLFRLFIDYLSFETSEGIVTGAVLKRRRDAIWVQEVEKFKQLKPIFIAQDKLLICTGYTHDNELIEKMTNICSLPFAPIQEENIGLVLEEISSLEEQRLEGMLEAVNASLRKFDCKAQIRRFYPMDLPTLYSVSDEVRFLRSVKKSSAIKGGMFSAALTSLFESVEERPLAVLYLNLNSPLVQRMADIRDSELLQSISRVLYVQALLAGGHSLQGSELKTMNRELLNLMEYNMQ